MEPGTNADPELLERLLDAAEASFDRHGVNKVSMDEIAALAGVSRAFVYKHLRNRDGLILAVLVRRARQFTDRAKGFIDAQPNLAESLVQGILLAVKLAHRDPYFGLLVGAATTDPAHRVEGAPEAAAALSDELWRPILERARTTGELAPTVDIDDAVQWIMNLELTLHANRSTFGTTEDVQERQLRTLFVPAMTTIDTGTGRTGEPVVSGTSRS